MEIELKSFTPAEQATFRLRALYEQAGYRKYRASRFEEYALYQEYQRFLPDSQVITFTDLDGKLRAIKPDVTLSIAKTAQPAAGECKRFYYNEEVCRPSRESHTFQTIHQMGLECMGEVDEAAQAEVELRMYRVIYDCINDVEAAMKGMLAPKFHEVIIGHAEVRQTFRVSKVGTVCGCYVQDGKIQRNCSVRVNRDNIVIFEGELASLRRFKDDVKEVAAGYECGMQVEKFNDIKEGDVIECFVNEQL